MTGLSMERGRPDGAMAEGGSKKIAAGARSQESQNNMVEPPSIY